MSKLTGIDNFIDYNDLMTWYLAVGVDETVNHTPFDFEQYKPPIKSHITQTEKKSFSEQLNASSVESINQKNDCLYHHHVAPFSKHMFKDLKSIYEHLNKNEEANFFAASAKHMLLPTGVLNEPDFAIVLDSPSEAEELSGQAFCGIEADILKKMLFSIGINPDTTAFLYMCPWRPPGQRQFSPKEIALFAPYLVASLRLINPKNILLSGQASFNALSDKNVTINRAMHKNISANPSICGDSFDNKGIYALHHPRQLVNTPLMKKKAWSNLLHIKQNVRTPCVA